MIIAEIFAGLVVFALCIAGVSSAVQHLAAAVLGRDCRKVMSVVLLSGADTEYLLRCAVASHPGDRIYGVDCGLDAEQRRIAINMAANHGCLVIISVADFIRMVEDLDFPEYRIKAG